jgi:hypothetical protein
MAEVLRQNMTITTPVKRIKDDEYIYKSKKGKK